MRVLQFMIWSVYHQQIATHKIHVLSAFAKIQFINPGPELAYPLPPELPPFKPERLDPGADRSASEGVVGVLKVLVSPTVRLFYTPVSLKEWE